MTKTDDRGHYDWLAEVAGAAALALAASFVALKLAPGMPAVLAAAATGAFAVALAALRAVPAEPRLIDLPGFVTVSLDDSELLLDELYLDVVAADELLLDQPLVAAAATDAIAELLLEDALPAPDPESRVVQLFAGPRMPTAGQLSQRIERHLAASEAQAAAPADAADALSEALAELRRSLRQA